MVDVMSRIREFKYSSVLVWSQMSQCIGNQSANGVGHTQAVLCIDAHPSQPWMVSGSTAGDCSIKLWADQPGQQS